MTVYEFLDSGWGPRLTLLFILVGAYFLGAHFMKKRPRPDREGPPLADALRRRPWELEKVTRCYSQHGLAECLDDYIHATLTFAKDGTFELACPINTFTGTWTAEGETCKLQVTQTSAREGDAKVLRAEQHTVSLLEGASEARLIHLRTALAFFGEGGELVALFAEKPRERFVFGKKVDASETPGKAQGKAQDRTQPGRRTP
ncbi:MAG: META domain-containing protein [Coriobacteriia bacterium]|nr:META domain-containing protein [Coriobacteriia bacterium]